MAIFGVCHWVLEQLASFLVDRIFADDGLAGHAEPLGHSIANNRRLRGEKVLEMRVAIWDREIAVGHACAIAQRPCTSRR